MVDPSSSRIQTGQPTVPSTISAPAAKEAAVTKRGDRRASLVGTSTLVGRAPDTTRTDAGSTLIDRSITPTKAGDPDRPPGARRASNAAQSTQVRPGDQLSKGEAPRRAFSSRASDAEKAQKLEEGITRTEKSRAEFEEMLQPKKQNLDELNKEIDTKTRQINAKKSQFLGRLRNYFSIKKLSNEIDSLTTQRLPIQRDVQGLEDQIADLDEDIDYKSSKLEQAISGRSGPITPEDLSSIGRSIGEDHISRAITNLMLDQSIIGETVEKDDKGKLKLEGWGHSKAASFVAAGFRGVDSLPYLSNDQNSILSALPDVLEDAASVRGNVQVADLQDAIDCLETGPPHNFFILHTGTSERESASSGSGIEQKGGNHATALMFVKQPDGNLTLQLHNTGYGLNKYHTQEGGKFQTFVEVKDISPETLSGNETALKDLIPFLDLGTAGPLNDLYATVQDLGGKGSFDPPREAAEHLQAPQSRGTCTVSCLRSCVRTLMMENGGGDLRAGEAAFDMVWSRGMDNILSKLEMTDLTPTQQQAAQTARTNITQQGQVLVEAQLASDPAAFEAIMAAGNELLSTPIDSNQFASSVTVTAPDGQTATLSTGRFKAVQAMAEQLQSTWLDQHFLGGEEVSRESLDPALQPLFDSHFQPLLDKMDRLSTSVRTLFSSSSLANEPDRIRRSDRNPSDKFWTSKDVKLLAKQIKNPAIIASLVSSAIGSEIETAIQEGMSDENLSEMLSTLQDEIYQIKDNYYSFASSREFRTPTHDPLEDLELSIGEHLTRISMGAVESLGQDLQQHTTHLLSGLETLFTENGYVDETPGEATLKERRDKDRISQTQKKTFTQGDDTITVTITASISPKTNEKTFTYKVIKGGGIVDMGGKNMSANDILRRNIPAVIASKLDFTLSNKSMLQVRKDQAKIDENIMKHLSGDDFSRLSYSSVIMGNSDPSPEDIRGLINDYALPGRFIALKRKGEWVNACVTRSDGDSLSLKYVTEDGSLRGIKVDLSNDAILSKIALTRETRIK